MLPFVGLNLFSIAYKLKLQDKKDITSFVSEVLQIFEVGHLLNLSTAMSLCVSLYSFLLRNFPVNSICVSCPGSDNFSNFPIFSIIDTLDFYLMLGMLCSFHFCFDVLFHVRPPEYFASDVIFVMLE